MNMNGTTHEELLEVIRQELNDPEASIRAMGVDRLAWLAPQNAPALLAPLLSDDCRTVRESVAAALGSIRNEQSISYLLSIFRLPDEEDGVLFQAVVSLANYDVGAIRDLLLEKLGDGSLAGLARMKAAQQLWRYDDDRVLGLLVKLATTDPDAAVRGHACEALSFLDRKRAFPEALTPVWQRLAGTSTGPLQEIAARALAARGQHQSGHRA